MSDHDTPEVGSGLDHDEWCICSTEFRAEHGDAHAPICSQQWGDLTRLLAARDAEPADRCSSYGGCDRAAEVETAHGRALVDLADMTARAESAEAERDALQAARTTAPCGCRHSLVAGCDHPSAEAERDTALREVAERDARLAKVEALAESLRESGSLPGRFIADSIDAALANPDGGGQ